MTFLMATFRYERTPGVRELEALDEVREVYGIWHLQFDEKNKLISIEYDGSRLAVDDIEFLLRNAGIDIRGPIAAAA
jgi:hypothetical protein